MEEKKGSGFPLDDLLDSVDGMELEDSQDWEKNTRSDRESKRNSWLGQFELQI